MCIHIVILELIHSILNFRNCKVNIVLVMMIVLSDLPLFVTTGMTDYQFVDEKIMETCFIILSLYHNNYTLN
jgi:hypothetical protein